MRVLYVDVDCLRPDHLGCFGYHRSTSPAIDEIARDGLRLNNVYVSDAPCLPSRTALFSGRLGVHTGVINHGGAAADPFIEGYSRGFSSMLGRTSWMRCLRNAGLRTATVSPFGERHSAWHFYANFNDVVNTGRRGLERADEIAPAAIDWLRRNGGDPHWFLHINMWDPHTPYRSPAAVVEGFSGSALPDWYSEKIRAAHWQGCGPHSAREVIGFDDRPPADYTAAYPLQPTSIGSMKDARRMFDGYDAGVMYADRHLSDIVAVLRDLGIYDDVAILVSSDHGENLGELNIYGDHHTADEATCHVPLILRWPGITDDLAGSVWSGIHYQVDVAATIVELVGGSVPSNWDGQSFSPSLRRGDDTGRPYVVLSQGAWTCQRSIRFRQGDREWLCIRTYHDGYHGFPNLMLFDLATDPHEQTDLADQHSTVVARALALLDDWHGEMMRSATHPIDPMWTVLGEGGPKHTRGQLPAYLERLRTTDRQQWAEHLAVRHNA
ncbi:MAG: sulfatase-like hydrolase/transferase [Proteobacteria bacterium]|nr:sulfatase-like hydrolase/transferase [Pseudomonadota bacterium]